jgi:hypothetical protein
MIFCDSKNSLNQEAKKTNLKIIFERFEIKNVILLLIT